MRLVVCLALLLGMGCHASDDLESAVREYLETASKPKVEKKWRKTWKSRAQQMMTDDQSLSCEERCADRVLFDYIADRVSKFLPGSQIALTEAEKVEVCRYYLLYLENGWEISERLKPFITLEYFDKFIRDKSVVQVIRQ